MRAGTLQVRLQSCTFWKYTTGTFFFCVCGSGHWDRARNDHACLSACVLFVVLLLSYTSVCSPASLDTLTAQHANRASGGGTATATQSVIVNSNK